MKTPFLVCAIILIQLTNGIFAQPGALDLSFGENGKVVTGNGAVSSVGHSVLIQPDKKIVVIGNCFEGGVSRDFLIIRYNPDGSPDTSFGLNGIVRMLISSVEDFASSAILQPDGKIIAAGYSWNGKDLDFTMVRYLSDGSRDASFGNGGIVTTDFGGNRDKANQIILQTDGKIVMVGATGKTDYTDQDVAIARYETSGALDHSFDLDGKIELSMGEPGFWQSAKGVAIQNDGKIVITGYTENFDTTKQYIEVHFLLLRINPDGTLDHSFSDHGVAITPIGKDDGSTSVVILSNGKILQLGNVNFELGDSSDMCLVQYNSDGTRDNSFGNEGKVMMSFTDFEETGYTLLLQNDQKILVAGAVCVDSSDNQDFFVARFHSNGLLDHTFGSMGKVTTDFFEDSDVARDMALQTDGQLVVAGYTTKGNGFDVGVVRYSNDASLPVDLLQFNAKPDEYNVVLNWTTGWEKNSGYFEIERSNSGTIWQSIGRVNANVDSEVKQVYHYSDLDPFFGRSYYPA